MTEDLLPNWDPEGETWPLLFTYVNLVDAASFRATVEISGALVAIIHPGDGSCWLDGVYPGGTAASGTNVDDAYANFREFITGIIHDMADAPGTPPLERRDSEGWTPDFAVHEATSTAIVSAEFDRSFPAQIAA